MAGIEWSDRYSVNIASMDEQHKKLIGMMGELNEKLKQGKAVEISGKILDGMLEYAVSHLNAEEKLMQTHGYPDFEAHKKLHDELKTQLGDLDAEVKKQPLVGTLKLSTFLYNWLTSHIQKTDKKYGEYLNAKGIN